jgi:hypothetical protein
MRRATMLGAVSEDPNAALQRVLAAYHHATLASQRMLHPQTSAAALLHIWGGFLEDT